MSETPFSAVVQASVVIMSDITWKQVETAVDCPHERDVEGLYCRPCQRILASAARALLGPTLLFRCSKCTCFISRRRGRSGGPCPYDHDTGGPTTECGGTLIPLVAGLEEE